ncbi:MAG: MmgE/PrpD family protein [Gordonia sp. (in: high G+C Gram-positive bacteria)]|uniref:MmgE/PrpD family protein n=1 Tax=Gordonia sp. (in: high G+C Gram-positive bacteria) TaxID=84139 RepID=UPI0039E25529
MTAAAPRTAATTAELARHVAGVAATPPTEHDVEALRRLLLDDFLVSLWGATRPVTAEVADWTARFAGTGSSRVLGRDWATESSIAALVHGTAAHAFELDDTHNATASHPGSVVMAVALAVAAEPGPPVTREQFFQAITAGYETTALLGEAAGGMAVVHRGFHPTSLLGTYGGATTALTLRRLRAGRSVDAVLLEEAWGHALSQPSGSMQFSAEATGGEVKRVHAGLGAHNAIRAADFAALPAVTAPYLAVEGVYGLAACFGSGPDPVRLDRGPAIHRISLKPYSCCRLFHSTIDALREVTDAFTLAPEDVADVLVTGPRLIAEQHLTPADSSMTAQYSCPFVVAATLAHGPEAYHAYAEENLGDPVVRRLMEKVRFEVDPEMEAAYYPEHFATAVRLELTDGTVRTALVADSIGTAERPMTVEHILAKAAGLADAGADGCGPRLRAVLWDHGSGPQQYAEALAAEANRIGAAQGARAVDER